MLKKKALLSLFILLSIIPESLYATETDVIQNKELIVQFEKPLQNAAKEIVDIYPALKSELEKTFKWKMDFKTKVIIIKDRKAFQRIIGTGPVVAVAMPQSNLIIIDYSKMNVHPFTLEITLKHELCHLMLHNYIKEENFPKWLDEGISQWVSGGIAEIIIGEKRDVLKEAALSGKFISLIDLTKQFPEDEKDFLLSYEESKSIVEYMIREFGTGSLLQILNYLKDGDEVDTAIFKGLAIHLYELENSWHDYLKKKITWVTYLSNNLYNVLFFLAALITIYGFIRLLIRKWTYKDDEEENPNDF